MIVSSGGCEWPSEGKKPKARSFRRERVRLAETGQPTGLFHFHSGGGVGMLLPISFSTGRGMTRGGWLPLMRLAMTWYSL